MECNNFQVCCSIDKTCRSCLSPRDNLHSIPTKMYTYCTSLPVNEDDELPKALCQACYDILSNFYYFKLQCIRSDSILRRQLMDQNVKEKAARDDVNTTAYCELDSKTELAVVPNNEDTSEIYVKQMKNEFDTTVKGHTTEPADGFRNNLKKCKNVLRKKNRKLLYCQKCDKTFYKYVKLEAHMRKHFGLKPDNVIKCNQCEKTFTTDKNLKSHLRVHTGERKYKCKLCGKAFAYSNVLKNHERAHAGIKKYVCQQCGKKFVQLTNLNTHMQLHTGEKPYSCGNCGRAFRQISELKMHLLRHTGVKDFACHICSLRFYTNFSLRKHMGVHSDARPFACNICDKKFKSQSYMVVHQRTHTGERPFSCDFCPLTFMSSKDRRNHRKIHTGEKASKANKTKLDQTNAEKLDSNLQQHHLISPLNVNAQIEGSISEYIPNAHHNLSELTPLKSPSKSICPYTNAAIAHEHYEPYEKSQNNFTQATLDNKNCSYVNSMY